MERAMNEGYKGKRKAWKMREREGVKGRGIGRRMEGIK